MIAAERSFLVRLTGNVAESAAALNHARALLPTLEAALAATGAERQCALTAHASTVAYEMLVTLDVLARSPRAAAIRRLQALLQEQRHLYEAEAADEARRGLIAGSRRNYPAWWEPGRTAATFYYWRSMCWRALLVSLRDATGPTLANIQRRARADAMEARRSYAEQLPGTAVNQRRHALAVLHQGEIELLIGDLTRASGYVEEATRLATASALPDVQVPCLLAKVDIIEAAAAAHWKDQAAQELRLAWTAAGTDERLQAAIRLKANKVFGEAWRPLSVKRRRGRSAARPGRSDR